MNQLERNCDQNLELMPSGDDSKILNSARPISLLTPFHWQSSIQVEKSLKKETLGIGMPIPLGVQ